MPLAFWTQTCPSQALARLLQGAGVANVVQKQTYAVNQNQRDYIHRRAQLFLRFCFGLCDARVYVAFLPINVFHTRFSESNMFDTFPTGA